jgi:hypothetical protein
VRQAGDAAFLQGAIDEHAQQRGWQQASAACHNDVIARTSAISKIVSYSRQTKACLSVDLMMFQRRSTPVSLAQSTGIEKNKESIHVRFTPKSGHQ